MAIIKDYCIHCDREKPLAQLEVTEYGLLCQRCYYDEYTLCSDCNKLIPNDEAIEDCGRKLCYSCHTTEYMFR